MKYRITSARDLLRRDHRREIIGAYVELAAVMLGLAAIVWCAAANW